VIPDKTSLAKRPRLYPLKASRIFGWKMSMALRESIA
jgi:hypothetical protein